MREMAAGARERDRARTSRSRPRASRDPTAAPPTHPVGTVCIALVGQRHRVSRRYQLRGTRDWIKMLTSQVALDWLRRYALGLPLGESVLFRR